MPIWQRLGRRDGPFGRVKTKKNNGSKETQNQRVAYFNKVSNPKQVYYILQYQYVAYSIL